MAVAIGLAFGAPSCRLHRLFHRHHGVAVVTPRDPRVRWTTGCADSRFVSTPPLAWLGPSPPASLPFAAGNDRIQAIGAVQDRHLRAVVHGHPGVVDIAVGDITGVVAVAAGASVIVAWSVAPQGIALASLGHDGSVRLFSAGDPLGMAVSNGQFPALAVGDGVVALAYRAPMESVSGIFVSRYDLATRRLRSTAARIASGPSVGAHAITWTGDRWAVAWVAEDTVWYATLARDGIRPTVSVPVIAPGATVDHVAMAGGDGRVAIAWSDRRGDSEALYSTAVDAADGTRTPAEQRLSARFDPGAVPSMAWDGGAFGITWWEPVNRGVSRAVFSLLDRDGDRVGLPMQVLTRVGVGLGTSTLAWGGRGYLLVNGQVDGTVAARGTGPRGCDEEP